ncbi:MAG TPA: glycosyltransferase family 2 protein [Roseiarcus sp.]|nr:glycosyltransferase family 2 protein [Roseiarcus sp.]
MTRTDLTMVERRFASQPARMEECRAKVCVGIATRGRPAQVQHVVRRLRRQSLRPSTIVVACVEPSDVAGLERAPDLRVVYGGPGLAKQRNLVLDCAPADADYVVYFDDDFLADDHWLEMAVAQFEADPAIACVTGNVIADGILGPGLTLEEGEAALDSADRRNLDWRIEDYSPYGCNMAYRASAIADLRFDERLVSYAWLEDRDFGARVSKRGGSLIKLGAALGVHLGVKQGRVSGKRLGYSQIINPSYMFAKGTISRRKAIVSALRNICANLAKSPWPETYIDRRGRLLGNALAMVDLVRGVCEPERAELL